MKTWKEMALDLSGKDILETVKYSLYAGVLSHGIAMFNKLSWRNDLDRGFTLPQAKALSLGRWFKAALCTLVAKAFGGKNLSLPLLFGVLSLLIIALSAHIIIRMFDIRSKILRVALCSIMVAFPVVTSTFGYMYAAPYYFFALFLAVLAVYIAANRPRWDGALVAAVCVSCCLGIYQAYFPLAVSAFVMLLIFEIAWDRFESVPKLILRGLYYLGVCVAGLILFFAIWKIVNKVMGISANDYQGMSSIGQSGIMAYVYAVKDAYKGLLPVKNTLYPMGLAYAQWIVLALCFITGACLAIRRFREKKLQAVVMAVLMAILPICFDLVYLLVASSSSSDAHVYTLMLYGQVMLYVFLVCALNELDDIKVKPVVAARRVGLVALALMICMDVYFDNACYLKAQFVQEQTISHLTVMISRIKSTEGYTDKTPVCFIQEGKQDATFTKNKAFADLEIAPYNWIFPYHKRNYFNNALKLWCGFDPKRLSADDFKDLEEVKAMPTYPDDGSVKMINDTVVVKW